MNNSNLYSQVLGNEALGQTVRAIPAKTDKFATNIIGGGEDTVLAQWKAWKDNDMSGWQVDRYDYFNGTGEDAVVQKKVMHRGISFFDALRVLSECEHVNKAKLHQALDEDTDGVHWSDAAKEAGQAVDIDNLVVPCAYGRILVDANVTGAQLKIAAKSEKPKEDTSRALVPSFAKSVMPDAHDVTVVPSTERRVASAAVCAATVKAGDRLLQELTDIKDREVAIGIYHFCLGAVPGGLLGVFPIAAGVSGPILTTLAVLGIGAATGGVVSRQQFMPFAHARMMVKYFRKVAEKLPEGTEKEATLQFADDADFACHMMKAQKSLRKNTPRGVRVATKEVMKAADVMGFTPEKSAILLENFLTKGASFTTDYDQKFKIQWESEIKPPLALTL